MTPIFLPANQSNITSFNIKKVKTKFESLCAIIFKNFEDNSISVNYIYLFQEASKLYINRGK